MHHPASATGANSFGDVWLTLLFSCWWATCQTLKIYINQPASRFFQLQSSGAYSLLKGVLSIFKEMHLWMGRTRSKWVVGLSRPRSSKKVQVCWRAGPSPNSLRILAQQKGRKCGGFYKSFGRFFLHHLSVFEIRANYLIRWIFSNLTFFLLVSPPHHAPWKALVWFW